MNIQILDSTNENLDTTSYTDVFEFNKMLAEHANHQDAKTTIKITWDNYDDYITTMYVYSKNCNLIAHIIKSYIKSSPKEMGTNSFIEWLIERFNIG